MEQFALLAENACKRNQMLMIFKHEASVCLSGDTQQGFWQRERERPLYEFERREKMMLTGSCPGLLSAGLTVPSCEPSQSQATCWSCWWRWRQSPRYALLHEMWTAACWDHSQFHYRSETNSAVYVR